MEEKSVFEILDFVLDPEKTHCISEGIVLDCTNVGTNISESVKRVLATQNGKNQIIHIHDAAVFSAYFGIPRDEVKRPSWDKLSFDEKVCKIKNDFSNFFSNGGYTSFTKIL